MRLIDADALKEKLNAKDAVVMTLLGIFELIDNMPTIDHISNNKKAEAMKVEEVRNNGSWSLCTN